jgi:DNA-directed RNA polymerase beta' subunit
MRRAIKNDAIAEVKDSEVDYEVTSPNQFFGSHLNLIPLQSSVQGSRLFYGSKFANQALPLISPEVPLVQNLADDDEQGRSFDDILGGSAGAKFADGDGVVQSVSDKFITVKQGDGTVKKVSLYNNFPFNRKTSIHNTAMVRKGQPIKQGDILAKSNYTDDKGSLALGLNARVGVVPYKGYSMEDAIVVSEAFAKRLTSEHMYTDDMEFKRGVKGGAAHYTGVFPHKYKKDQLGKLDKEGVARVGQVVSEGDPIVLATKPRTVSSASQKLGKLSTHMRNARNDATLTWKHHNDGIITDVVRTKSGVKVTVKSHEEAMPGDKIVFRSGQKGTISKIIGNNHMPRTVDGKPLEVLMNPLGIPSRINNSMIYELLLGKIAKAKGENYKLPSFTKPGEKWHDFVEKEMADNGIRDTEEVFDPEINRKLKKPITVGDGYMWKLHHTANKGFSARSQGAYDINEQPLKGGDELAQSKRLSGLETHGLLSSGAYGVLKDSTLVRGARNDDYWQQLRSGYDPKMPDTPMVYNKFKTLLQGAGYHARQTNKKGGLRLGPLTEKVLDDLKPVEIKNPGLIDSRRLAKGNVVPVKGGLFDDTITFSNKYGYVKMPFEIPNPAFEEPVRKILGLTEKQFRSIMSGKEELPPELVKRMEKFVKKASAASRRAVIIKGNPNFVEGSQKELAEPFYNELKELVEAQGYETSFDAGEPDTEPEPADLWVGHSRGQDRLRFAPEGTETLAVDQYEDRAEERREETAKLMEEAGHDNWPDFVDATGWAPPEEHYQVTDALREAIINTQPKQASAAAPQSHTGPAAIAAALRTFSREDVASMAKAKLNSGRKSDRGTGVKLMRYAHGLDRNKIEPSDYLIKRVPVIPPKFRPFNVLGNSFIPGDANELYKDLFEVRDSYSQLNSLLGPQASGAAGLNVYDSVKAVYGFGDPVQPKTKQRGVSGFLKKITGSQAKYGFFQRRLLSKPVDSSARGIIGIDPELDLDQIGIPEEMGWKIYAPYIHRRLVRGGAKSTDAAVSVRDRTPSAKKAMELESQDRPVIYSRAPAWHKFNATAATPKFIEGETIMINPLVTSGHNADFDGDAMNVQVPSLPEAVDDAKNKLMPSKMLFSIKKRDEVVPKPAHEFILGLYTAQQKPSENVHDFADKDQALRAIKTGQVDLNDEIMVGGKKNF